MSCRHCTFNKWIAPYELDDNPVRVCGDEYDNHDIYVLAYPDGAFALARYWLDNGYLPVTHCPYCGSKLKRPAEEIFERAERDFAEARRKNKQKEINDEIKKLEEERDSL